MTTTVTPSTQQRTLDHHPLSEYAAPPRAVVIHDPTRVGALKNLRGLNPEASQELFLFRALPDEAQFAQDHQAFAETLRQHVPQVLQLTDVLHPEDREEFQFELQRNPNLVYTRDAVFTLPWHPEGFVVCNMGKPIRSEEPRVMERALRRLGLQPILHTPGHLVLEGGDVIPHVLNGQRMLLVGYGRRTTRETLYHLRDHLVREQQVVDAVLGIELAQWRINLDGGMVPLAEDVIVMHPQSLLSGLLLDAQGERNVDPVDFFRGHGVHLVTASQDESLLRQACNCFCVGNRTAVAYDLVPHVVEELRRHHIQLHTIPGQQLVKGTGGPRCMTRPIYQDISL